MVSILMQYLCMSKIVEHSDRQILHYKENIDYKTLIVTLLEIQP